MDTKYLCPECLTVSKERKWLEKTGYFLGGKKAGLMMSIREAKGEEIDGEFAQYACPNCEEDIRVEDIVEVSFNLEMKSGWFNFTRWSDDDIAENLEVNGIPVTKENITIFFSELFEDTKDEMVREGMETLHEVISMSKEKFNLK